jgi:hypothetical protein
MFRIRAEVTVSAGSARSARVDAPDMSRQPGGRTFLGLVRLVGAVAVLLIALLAALVVLDILPDSLLSELAGKIFMVAVIAAAALGIASLMVGGRRD